jgi:hypothetical protein
VGFHLIFRDFVNVEEKILVLLPATCLFNKTSRDNSRIITAFEVICLSTRAGKPIKVFLKSIARKLGHGSRKVLKGYF